MNTVPRKGSIQPQGRAMTQGFAGDDLVYISSNYNYILYIVYSSSLFRGKGLAWH